MAEVFLLQGSNQMNKSSYLNLSIDHIASKLGNINVLSDFYESEPWKMQNCPTFWNQLVVLTTSLSPIMLLKNILDIEYNCGRKNKSFNGNYQNRNIDIDILFYNQLIFQSPNLIIPHPLIHLRRFVLKPLYDSFPKMIHPIFKRDISTLLMTCSDTLRVEKIRLFSV